MLHRIDRFSTVLIYIEYNYGTSHCEDAYSLQAVRMYSAPFAHYGLVTPSGSIELSNTDDAKSLPEPVVIYYYYGLWYSPESNFTANAQATILYNEFEN